MAVSKASMTSSAATQPSHDDDCVMVDFESVYDDEERKWVSKVGVENIGKKLVNSKEGPPTFEQPNMTLREFLEYGNMLVQEQENVKRVQSAEKYLKEAAFGEANENT
ncbi:hypothetical protein FNV43_RR09827 [Rhamnella rubrinervis]|uniref:Ribulose bisphosphate carboxylase/oxygenase activase AAA helical domain-containing protein n=1 Tax=Rhamnella rubrinervis TaxID=2594499 RepID=A0A8K0HBH8_9ROSA|nr:hypothetical protein FNV43_RR09827 [Rhamnella rubrinervis]